MKALLVTSEVTYVPDNYAGLFEEVCHGAREHLAGLVVLKNFDSKLLLQAVGLSFMGCRGVSAEMLKNIVRLPLRKRETIFKKIGLPVLREKSMNDPEMIEWVKRNGIDLIVNVRTRCIYRSEILKAPKIGCINIHHGILPEYRGTLCDLYALYEGRPAGFTIHVMNEKIDAGKILHKQAVSQGDDKNYVQYLARTGREEGRALAQLIQQIARDGGLPEGESNVCAKPTYTRNPNRDQIRKMREIGMVL